MAQIEPKIAPTSAEIPVKTRSKGEPYRFVVEIIDEEEGDYSAAALNLPGTVSRGDTETEAIENFKEAAAAVVESYISAHEDIPWEKVDIANIPSGAKWILVDALSCPESLHPTQERKTFRCEVYLLEEDGGGYSIRAASLPGVASQGETESDAMDNIVEAFEGVLASYKEHGEDIPWTESPRELEPGEFIRWVTVHG